MSWVFIELDETLKLKFEITTSSPNNCQLQKMADHRIRPLGADLAHRVRSHAAVVDLPAALDAVLANSADAGATEVVVVLDLERLGFTVTDNGAGIHPDDMAMVGERFCTTKVRSVRQLQQYQSRGFRGESLSSLGAMSVLTVKSKHSDFNGTYSTRIHNGNRVIKCEKADSELIVQQGTIVKVQQMFHCMPVRLKHLKEIPETKTLQKVRELVFEYGVGCPRMKLIVRKVTGFGASPCSRVDAAQDDASSHWPSCMEDVYDIALREDIKHMEYASKLMRQHVYMSTVPVQTRAHQYIFLNGRRIANCFQKDLDIELGQGGYHYTDGSITPTLSPKRGKAATTVGASYTKYPVIMISIERDNCSRDLETGLPKLQQSDVDQCRKAISRAMGTFRKRRVPKRTYDMIDPPERGQNLAIERFATNANIKMGSLRQREIQGMISSGCKTPPSRTAEQATALEDLIKRCKLINNPQSDHAANLRQEGNCSNDKVIVDTEHIAKDLFKNCSIVSQVDEKFILVRSKLEPRLYIVDQHACDERIRVEELYKETIEKAKDPTQSLSVLMDSSIITVIKRGMAELLSLYKPQLRTWGIQYMVCTSSLELTITHLPEIMHTKVDGDNTFIVGSIVQYVHDLEDKAKLKTLPHEWYLALQSMPTVMIQLLNSRACRSAIMFGRKLTTRECEVLVEKLAQCKQPFQCAHGRPSIVPICEYSQL